jgi:hypothetical protein
LAFTCALHHHRGLVNSPVWRLKTKTRANNSKESWRNPREQNGSQKCIANQKTKAGMPNLTLVDEGAMRTPKVVNEWFSFIIILQHCSTRKKHV